MTGDEFDFGKIVGDVARLLLDEPNKHLSNSKELRYGDRGALSIDLEKGVWTDFSNEHGSINSGGCLQLIERETGKSGKAAIDWLRSNGFDIPDRDRPAQPKPQEIPQKVVATYDYQDENGKLLMQACRLGPVKDFRQRRPDGKGGWSWSVKGVRQVPYRLPELLEDLGAQRQIIVVEGEKDVDNLRDLGLASTCNAMGAGKWPDGLTPFFKDADVVIVRDNDESGQNHTILVASKLDGVASRLQVLDPPNVPVKGDISDWLEAHPGSTAFDVQALIAKEAKVWCKAAPQSRFGAVEWSNMDVVTFRQEWLIEDILFEGDGCLMYGESMCGKSFVALDAALAIARGSQFLGKTTKQGSVIYQAGEGGKGLLKRLKAYRQHHEITAPLPFVLMTSKVDLFSPDGDAKALLEEVMAWKAALPPPLALLVIDTFATASPGANENTSQDMSRVLANLETIQRQADVAVMIVHHKNANGEKPRGHTSLFAGADSAIEVLRDKDSNQRSFRIAKVKDSEDGGEVPFLLQPLTIGAYDSGKPMTSCVVAPLEAESQATGDRMGKRLTTAHLLFLRSLRDAVGHEGVQLPSGINCPRGAYGVDWKAFREAYKQNCDPDRTPGAINVAIKRDGDFLLTRGFIGRDSPYVWLTSKGREM